MSDEKKNPIPADADDATEDILPERKIKSADTVHTAPNKGDALFIPETAAQEPPKTERRFIKTGDAEYVSVHGGKSEEATDVEKYTDRLDAAPAPAALPPENTDKADTYDTVHAPAAGGRMIVSDAKNEPAPARKEQTDQNKEEAPEQLTMQGMHPDERTKRVDLRPQDEDGKEPTKHFDLQGARLREIADTAGDDVRRNPDQMMMEGFDEIGKKTDAERREDAELQEQLQQARADRVKRFRFWNSAPGEAESDGESADAKFSHTKKTHDLPAFAQRFSARFQHLATPFIPVKCEEYSDAGNRKTVFDAIRNARTRAFVSAVVLAAFAVILLITDLAAKITAGNNGGFFTVMGGSVNALTVFNLVFLLLACAVMLPDLKNGVVSILKLRPKTEALILLMMISAVAQTVSCFFTQLKIASDFQLMAPAAVIVCVPVLLSKVFYYDNARQIFKTVSGKSEKSYLRKVTDPELKARLGCSDDKNTVYAGRTRAVSGFPASAESAPRDEMPPTRVSAVIGGVALIAALITLIIKKSFICSVTTLTLCLALSLPVCCLLAGSYFLSRANTKLSVKSSFIQSFADAKAFTVIDTVTCDAAEIFDAEIKNCLTAKGVSEKQVRFAAAAVAAGTDSMLRKVFREEIERYEDKLPPAQSTVYEDKLGVSSYVGGCTVLLGNHDLLENHNVPLPDEALVLRFIGEDEKPLYLAMEGRFTALFAVKYTVPQEVSRGISDLVNGGASLQMSTTDPNVSETYAETLLGIGENSIRMMGSAAAKKLNAARAAVTDAEEIGVAFTDSFVSLSRVAAQGVKLDSVNTVSTAICLAGAFVSLLIGLILSVTGAFASVTAFPVLVIQGLWLAACMLSPLFTASVIKLTRKALSLFNGKKKKEEKMPEAAAEEEAESETPDGIFEDEIDAADDDTAVYAANDAEEETDAADAQEDPAAPLIPPTLDPDAIEAAEPRPVNPEVSDDVLESLRTFAPKDAPTKKEEAEEPRSRFIASEEMRSSFSSVDGYVEHLAAENTPEAPEAAQDFSLYGSEGAGKGPSAAEIENAYEQSKKEESAVRSAFTPPPAPAAPVFDYHTPAQEKPADEEPLDTSDVNVYNDDLFRRFETDDDVFAGLHDNENENHYDF